MKSKIVWLSKDTLVYAVSRTKREAVLCADGADDGIFSFCVPDFERLTGIKLKAGEVRKVRLEVFNG